MVRSPEFDAEGGGVTSDKVVAEDDTDIVEAGFRGDVDALSGRNLFKRNSPEFRSYRHRMGSTIVNGQFAFPLFALPELAATFFRIKG